MGISAEYLTNYDPDADFDALYTRATGEAIAEKLEAREQVLELGCATGLMTTYFVARGATVVGVDRSPKYLARARSRRLAHTRWEQGDVCEFLSAHNATYDHVTVCNLLHELNEPEETLKLCRSHLRPGGLLHVTLQNPNSLHRVIALRTGMIDDLLSISDRGSSFGTIRLMSLENLIRLIEGAGFGVLGYRGLVLKPYPNEQMERLPDEIIDGLVAGARYLPKNSAINYVVARA